MSILGKLFSRLAAGDDDDDLVFRPSRKFTRQDIAKLADRGASEFRARALNLLSCYELEGEFGLWATLLNFTQTKSSMAEIEAAIVDGDEVALIEAFRRSLEQSFVSLVEKNALKRIQLVETLPAEANEEYERMRRSVVITKAPEAVRVEVAPAAPVIRETPVEVCAREFRELPSASWKKKWLDDTRNRKITDQAFAEGRI